MTGFAGLGCDKFVGHFQFFWDPEIYLVMHGALTVPHPSDDVPADDGSDDGTDDDDEPGVPVTDSAGCTAGGPAAGHGSLLVVGAIVIGIRRRRASRAQRRRRQGS